MLDVGLKIYNLYFVGQRMRTRWLGGHHFCVLVHVCAKTCVCVSERKHRRIPGKMTVRCLVRKLTCLWILWRPYFGFFNIATFWNRNILFWISLETIFVYVLDVGLKIYNLYFVGQRMRTRWLGGHHFCVLVHVCVPERVCVCVWAQASEDTWEDDSPGLRVQARLYSWVDLMF